MDISTCSSITPPNIGKNRQFVSLDVASETKKKKKNDGVPVDSIASPLSRFQEHRTKNRKLKSFSSKSSFKSLQERIYDATINPPKTLPDLEKSKIPKSSHEKKSSNTYHSNCNGNIYPEDVYFSMSNNFYYGQRNLAMFQIPYTSPTSQISSHPHKYIIPIGDPKLQIYRLMLPPDLLLLLNPILNICKISIDSWETNLYSLTKQNVALRDVPEAFILAKPILSYITHVLSVVYTEKWRGWGRQGFGATRSVGRIEMDRNQPHILKYSMESSNTGVQLHYDNCDLTVNLMMSKKDEYNGGGTYFHDANEVVKLNQGEFIVHPGRCVHCGLDITDGARYLMVMFANLVPL